MNGLNYLLQTNLYLLLFMGFYVLVLRNETFFRQNRFFLNTSIFLSFLIPFINSDWFRDLFITQKVREAAIMPSQMIYDTIVVGINEEAPSLTVADAIFWIYIVGATALLIRFFIRIALLKSNLKAKKGSAFSFFNTLVVDKAMPEADTIIDHEKVHMRQWHSVDIIFIELAAIINWFNPVMYLYKKEIRHIHEFIADEEAATLMQSKADYALLLFSNTLGVDPLHLSNNFFNKSLLKRRILMLHKNRSRSTGLWKYGFSAPLFMLMLIVSAATASSESNALSIDGERSISSLETLGTLPLPEVINNKPNEAGISVNTEGHLAKPGTYNVPVGSTTKDVPNLAGSATDLKNHIVKTIKYTAGARADKAHGYIQVNFMVRNKQISDVEITKSLHSELDKEVLKAFASFNSDIELPDNDYAIAVEFLTGAPISSQNIEKIPRSVLFADNFLGIVLGIIKETEDLKLSWVTMTGNTKTLQDQFPQFPGGYKALAEYINKNLKYPALAKANKISGRVILSFVVDIDGSIEDIRVMRGIGGGADEEAVRVIARSPKWKPGIKNGVPAKVAYTMPIAFALAGKLPQNPYVDPNPTASNKPSVLVDVKDFSEVEVLPEFAGGMAGWGKYLTANLKYPEQAKKDKVTGRVIMGFIVEKDGSLSDIKVIRGIDAGLDEEAVRVLKAAPNWKPGILGGRPVRVAYTMPIFFQVGSK